jgi:hypothetical protein
MNKCIVKNVTPDLIFEAYGNSGANFRFNNPYEIPKEPLCPIVTQENRKIEILTESEESLLIYC